MTEEIPKYLFEKSLHAELVKTHQELEQTQKQMFKCADIMKKTGKVGSINGLLIHANEMVHTGNSLNNWMDAVHIIINNNLRKIIQGGGTIADTSNKTGQEDNSSTN